MRAGASEGPGHGRSERAAVGGPIRSALRAALFAGAMLAGAAELVGAESAPSVHRAAGVEAWVRQPSVVRGGQRAQIDVEVRCTSPSPCDLEIAISPEFADSFADVAMFPEPTDDWTVRLGPVPPGEDRLVAIELEASVPGPHTGELTIRDRRGQALLVGMRTFVAP